VAPGPGQGVAQLQAQRDVAGLEGDVGLEVATGAVDVLAGQRQIGQRAQRLLLERALAGVAGSGPPRSARLASGKLDRPRGTSCADLDQHRRIAGRARPPRARSSVSAVASSPLGAGQPPRHDQEWRSRPAWLARTLSYSLRSSSTVR
jgi:hypothetical protein